jgi:hypothetical protein
VIVEWEKAAVEQSLGACVEKKDISQMLASKQGKKKDY